MSTNIGRPSRMCAKCKKFRQFAWVSHEPELQKRGAEGYICGDCRRDEDRQVVLK